MAVMKPCSKCGYEKENSVEFFRASRHPGKLRADCRECERAANRKYHKDNRADISARPTVKWGNYNRQCKALYGITAGDVELMLIAQGGLCMCCLEPIPEPHRNSMCSRMHVDHDHKTGEVRGLLCHHCNVAIGQVEVIGIDNILRYLDA